MQSSIDSAASPRSTLLHRLFAPAPAIEPLKLDPRQTQRVFVRWRWRILIATIIGYALFYFVRKNLSIAMPAMESSLGIKKTDLGLFLTLHGLLYGVSRFANGYWADRANARSLMSIGLLLSAGLNIYFGLSSTVLSLGLIWMANGWVQGMGFPPCCRLMTHWFEPRELARKMSIWNTSHSIGAGLVAVLCGYLATIDWRLCFYIPAALAIGGAIYLWHALPDTPPSVGLPEVPGTEQAAHPTGAGDSHHVFLVKHVFKNPYIWLLSAANFFVYIVRYGVFDWGTTLLKQHKGFSLSNAGWMVAGFEVAGVIGMLLAGWMTDRIFGGRGARACFFYMGMTGVSVLLFWKVAGESQALCMAFLCAAGFFIYGPQALIGIIVANLATKRAAAGAAGFTGIWGYASTLLSGWGFGALVQYHGWDAGLLALVISAAIGTLLFAACWGAKAHGYAHQH